MLQMALGLLAAICAAILLVYAHYRFWSWRLRVPDGGDEVLFARTADRWDLGIGRRRPRGRSRRPPVVLCHGVSTNRGSLDFGIERYSLAGYLSREGFDCFSLELRGHGTSRPLPTAPRRASFDTYLAQDVPASLDRVREATGDERVLWVGHSLGALLGLASCGAYPNRIRGIVAIAGPAHFHAQEDLRRLLRRGWLVSGRWNRLLARCVAPFSGVWHPPISELTINGRNVERAVYRRLLANVIEDISPGVFAQLACWVREDRFASEDGAVDYRERLAACRQPALFVSAAEDGLAPPEVVRAGFENWGGEKSFWNAGRAEGLREDYGHTDLIYGRDAPEEVFPRVRDWLVAHSE